MAANLISFLENKVDQLFAALNAQHGDCCRNPVTGEDFVWGIDPIGPQKTEAVRALRAREWFAVNGPTNAPPLPLSYEEIDDYRQARGLQPSLASTLDRSPEKATAGDHTMSVTTLHSTTSPAV